MLPAESEARLFEFDQTDEEILIGYASAEIDMMSVVAGVINIGLDVREGVRVRARPNPDVPDVAELARLNALREADIAAGRPVGAFSSYSIMVEKFGEQGLANLSQGRPPRSKSSTASYLRRSGLIEDAAKKLLEQLLTVRTTFVTDFEIADCRDGPPGYDFAVRACVDRLIPPPTVSNAIERVKTIRRKMPTYKHNGASRDDRVEIGEYIKFASWFAERFDILDVPSPPNLRGLHLGPAGDYLRDVLKAFEASQTKRLDYDTQIAKHFREQDTDTISGRLLHVVQSAARKCSAMTKAYDELRRNSSAAPPAFRERLCSC